MKRDQLIRLQIFSKGIGVRLSTIYHQLQSGRREKRRSICMSLMISSQLVGALLCCVHTSQMSWKSSPPPPTKIEKELLPPCAWSSREPIARVYVEFGLKRSGSLQLWQFLPLPIGHDKGDLSSGKSMRDAQTNLNVVTDDTAVV